MKTVEIRKFISPEILIGNDTRLLAANYIKGMNIKRLLLITDKNIKDKSWFNDITESLKEQHIQYVIYDKVSPNSPDIEVMEGLEYYTENQCTGILAVGGGSVLDSAKGVGIVYSNHKHILNFEGVDKIRTPPPPLICIPTTSGTSSDVSQFCIIRDLSRLVKIAIVSKSLVPDITLIDPLVTLTMDPHLTACTGMDAMTHAVEAFVSKGNAAITDLHALAAIELIYKNLETACHEPENFTARHNMMLGSLYAGLAFSNASLGAVHALAHSIGGYFNSAHGENNALLLQHVIAFNYPAVPEKFNKIAEILGIDTKQISNSKRCEAITNCIINLKKNIGLDYSLNKLGIKTVDIPLLASNALFDACMLTNPRDANIDDLKTVLSNAI